MGECIMIETLYRMIEKDIEEHKSKFNPIDDWEDGYLNGMLSGLRTCLNRIRQLQDLEMDLYYKALKENTKCSKQS